MSNTHVTAPTRFVEVNGDRFAYRSWGNPRTDQPPLFFQHFRGALEVLIALIAILGTVLAVRWARLPSQKYDL